MTESLNKLTEYLRTKNDTEKYDLSKFRLLQKHFQQYSKEHLKLLIRKWFYLYEYIERFKETELPPEEAFFSSLYGEHIKPEDYDHAQKVWQGFHINNLGSTMICT